VSALPRRAVLAVVVALVAVLAVPPLASARSGSDFIGITSEDVFAGDAAYRADNLRAQSRLGIGLIRQTFDWARIERARGQYDFSYHDEFVAAAASHGITVLPILFNPPSFHLGRRHHRYTCPPKRNASMAAFAQALVRRYGPRGTLWAERPGLRKLPLRSWQIWNEPNLTQYWCGGRPNAKRYVAMLATVGRAIERVDRGAHIVSAGLPRSLQGNAVPLDRYLDQMYSAGAARHFDSLAINSYAKDHRELGRLLGSVRKLMNGRGDRRGQIWITELGWGDRGMKHRFIVGEKGQASRISKSLALIRKQRRRLRLRGVVYFSWRDAAPYPPAYENMWGLHTGLLDIKGAPKRAFHVFAQRAKAFRR
jgi:polysaccharide biosynthesis protein PslG